MIYIHDCFLINYINIVNSLVNNVIIVNIILLTSLTTHVKEMNNLIII